MKDNEESIAQLLYHIWSADADKPWSSLSPADHARWQRLVRFTLAREVALTVKFANERYYSEYTKRLVTRIETWQKESALYKKANEA